MVMDCKSHSLHLLTLTPPTVKNRMKERPVIPQASQHLLSSLSHNPIVVSQQAPGATGGRVSRRPGAAPQEESLRVLRLGLVSRDCDGSEEEAGDYRLG
jgi:hypothetical protein